MANDIKSIFTAITPENIQSVPVIQDAMDIFIRTIDEICSESVDIKNVFGGRTDEVKAYFADNPTIKEELIKIYLDDLYNVLQQLQFNQKISDYIEKVNEFYGTEYYKKDVIFSIADYINEEHFVTIKSYKENKGTNDGIRYMYNLILSFIEIHDNDLYPFTIEELAPFNFKVKGSLPAEFYDGLVRPLAHPLGFTYIYERVFQLVLEDFFPEASFIYHTDILEVRCLKPDGSTYTTRYIGELTPEDIANGVIDKTTCTACENGVREVIKITIEETASQKVIRTFFNDGIDGTLTDCTFLEQVTTSAGQTHVYYKHYEENQDHVLIFAYEDQCSIYHIYDFEFRTALLEEFGTNEYWWHDDYVPRQNIDKINEFITDDSVVIGYMTDPPDENTTILIGDFKIGVGSVDEVTYGFNPYRNEDGSIVLPGESGGRQELFYEPPPEADIDLLLGKYELDVPIYDGGTLLGIEHIHYTGVVDPALAVRSDYISVQSYNAQNLENYIYLAKDFKGEAIYFGTDIGIHHEPLYGGAGIDALNIIGGYDLNGDPKLIGPEWSIGYAVPAGANLAPDGAFYYVDVEVNGDPVNLQFYTREHFVDTTTFDSDLHDQDIVPDWSEGEFDFITPSSLITDNYPDPIEGDYYQLFFGALTETVSLSESTVTTIIPEPLEDIIPAWSDPILSSDTNLYQMIENYEALIESTITGFIYDEEDLYGNISETFDFTLGGEELIDAFIITSDTTTVFEASDFGSDTFEEDSVVQDVSSVTNKYNQESQISTEFDLSQTFGLDDFNIGDEYIGSGIVQVEVTADPYFDVEKFNIFSDSNFECGVYRDGVLLEDGNYAAWSG